jgi:hypothetical protein
LGTAVVFAVGRRFVAPPNADSAKNGIIAAKLNEQSDVGQVDKGEM